MKNMLTRLAAGLGTAALAASTLLVTATAAQAADGVLTVNVVDQFGRPATGVMAAYANGISVSEVGGTQVVGPSHSFPVAADSSFSFVSLTPWSGVECFGASPCAITTSPTVFTPVVSATTDATTQYTVRVTVATITGGPAVGSPLTVEVPQGMQILHAAVAAAGPPYSGLSTTIAQQWTRGGADLPGATNSSYTTVREDGGQPVAARLTPSPAMAAVYGQAGVAVPALTTNAINVVKPVAQSTTTKVSLAKRVKASEKVTMKVTVTAPSGTPDGTVTVSIGKFKTQKSLANGSVLVNLPRLAPGKYKVKVTYDGSQDFVTSKATKKKITVRR